METKTNGQIEAEISEVITKFKVEHIGKGPKEAKTYIIEDMVVIRLKGALTTLEQQLSKSSEGMELVKRGRLYLLEKAQSVLGNLLHNLLGVDITSFYADVNVEVAEMFIVLGLSKNVEEKLQVIKS